MLAMQNKRNIVFIGEKYLNSL